MYNISHHCWYCQRPFVIHAPLPYYPNLSVGHRAQSLDRAQPVEHFPSRDEEQMGSFKKVNEKQAHWTKQRSSDYAKQFDQWAK